MRRKTYYRAAIVSGAGERVYFDFPIKDRNKAMEYAKSKGFGDVVSLTRLPLCYSPYKPSCQPAQLFGGSCLRDWLYKAGAGVSANDMTGFTYMARRHIEDQLQEICPEAIAGLKGPSGSLLEEYANSLDLLTAIVLDAGYMPVVSLLPRKTASAVFSGLFELSARQKIPYEDTSESPRQIPRTEELLQTIVSELRTMYARAAADENRLNDRLTDAGEASDDERMRHEYLFGRFSGISEALTYVEGVKEDLA